MSATFTNNTAIALDELLSYEDEHFIHGAYQTLLGRAPDPDGMCGYLGLLRTGTSKVEIISQLQLSEEGKSWGIKFDLSLPHIGLAATSLEELLSYHDKRFVHCAYQTLLGRAPDAEGMRHYHARLRAGADKIELLTELHSSAEGRPRPISIYALKKAIENHQRHKSSLLGGLSGLFGLGNAKLEADRKLRAIENNSYALDVNVQLRFAELNWAACQLKSSSDRAAQTTLQLQQALTETNLTLTQLQHSMARSKGAMQEAEKVVADSDVETKSALSVPDINPHDPIGDRVRATLTEISLRLQKAK
jgi:hypothetical protein